MARMQLGFNISPAGDFNAPAELCENQVHSNMLPFLVKIFAQTQDGQQVGEFTGFLYSAASTGIVTVGHIVGFQGSSVTTSGAPLVSEKFRVLYTDGTEEDAVLMKHAPNNLPDIAILRGSRCAPRSLFGTVWATGDIIYAIGFSPASRDPGTSKGTVSCDTVGSIAIAAHADDGYPGGPVVNWRGRLVGIIKGPIGSTAKQLGLPQLWTFTLSCCRQGS
ncbi:hypothetical protein Vafri_12091 [Volvox africanus]|uniref:Serine protease n=1 Tax=Volvox africanus TaxID=51714 RepID=A0A8J4B9A2_9CHLO|nr:hypothetical protein Vafri_12091 [Volvox africanus]